MPVGTDIKGKEKNMDERQLVVFRIGHEEFGVNIDEVREIIRMEKVTQIPNTPGYIKGVINLRGNIIVVIDLAMKLGFPTKETDKDTRIIVIKVENNTVGMVVDYATEVLRLAGDKIEPAPAIITSKIEADYIEGVGVLDERLLTLLDLAKVLKAKDAEYIRTIQKQDPDKIIEAGKGLTAGKEKEEDSKLYEPVKNKEEPKSVKKEEKSETQESDTKSEAKTGKKKEENTELKKPGEAEKEAILGKKEEPITA